MTEYKACSRCKQILPYEAFNKKSSSSTGLSSGCRDCDNAAKRNLTPQQRHRKNAKNREYRVDNPDAVRATNHQQYLNKREERIAYAFARQKAYPEKYRAYAKTSKSRRKLENAADTRRRNARKKTNGIYVISKKELQRLHSSPCFYCGVNEKMTVDHIIAIARGGTDSIGNLVPACKSCNSQKRHLTIMEWRLKRKSPSAYAR